MFITFYGGTEVVTGANFLLEIGGGERYLVDCGLFQGDKGNDAKNRQKFPYDPAGIQALFVTHAHLDHVGRIAKLYHDGFRGKIYSTAPTREIAYYVMLDSMRVLEKDSRHAGVEPLYTKDDVEQVMSLWEAKEYHESFQVGSLEVLMRDAGHILGSTMFEFTAAGKKVVFTGDLGNSPSPLLPDTELLQNVDYLVMESVYGDRNHEDRSERRQKLEDIIEETMKRGGTLLIPAFSIERTQELLFEIENMMENSRIPLVPVFLDSPLAIEVTSIYKKYSQYLNEGVRDIIAKGDGIFRFPQFHETMSTIESKTIVAANPRKIIIAGSGMSVGGRIVHHEKQYLSDPKNTLLLVGYQSPGTLGRILGDGMKNVRILGEEITVNAEVASISGYSAHKDSDHLLEFAHHTADSLKQVFVVMGEPKSSLFLVQRIRDYLGVNAIAPAEAERVELPL